MQSDATAIVPMVEQSTELQAFRPTKRVTTFEMVCDPDFFDMITTVACFLEERATHVTHETGAVPLFEYPIVRNAFRGAIVDLLEAGTVQGFDIDEWFFDLVPTRPPPPPYYEGPPLPPLEPRDDWGTPLIALEKSIPGSVQLMASAAAQQIKVTSKRYQTRASARGYNAFQSVRAKRGSTPWG